MTLTERADPFKYIRIESKRSDGTWQGDPPADTRASRVRTMLKGKPLESGDVVEVRIQGKWIHGKYLGPEHGSMNYRIDVELLVDGTDEEAHLEMSLRGMVRWPKEAV